MLFRKHETRSSKFPSFCYATSPYADSFCLWQVILYAVAVMRLFRDAGCRASTYKELTTLFLDGAEPSKGKGT